MRPANNGVPDASDVTLSHYRSVQAAALVPAVPSTHHDTQVLLPQSHLSMQSSLRRQEQQESVSPNQLQAEAVLGNYSRRTGQLAVPCAADD